MPRRNTIGTFWERVNQGDRDECWSWLGTVTHNGYGRFRFEGDLHYAHRFSYILSHGDLDDGDVVRHIICDNRLCVNPRHMDIDTRENTMRETTSGIKNANAKLKASDIKAIRRQSDLGVGSRSLSDRYGVTPATIRSIVAGDSWSHVS